ncbi:MAG TPA: hypothetical protein VGI45_08020 [Terracidiphilus sp.]
MIAISNPLVANYRLIFASASTRRIVVERSEQEWRLPRIAIPRWTRSAEEIQTAIEERWGSRAVVLDLFGDGSLPNSRSPLALAELRGSRDTRRLSRGRWANLNEVGRHEISYSERVLIASLLDRGATGRGLFSRFGWVEEALDWLSSETGIDRPQFSDDIKQFNAGESCALVRFGRKDAPPLWFKANATPSNSEYSITTKLSQLVPGFLPTVVATRKDWRAWWMEDAGCPFADSRSPDSLADALARLAELQRASISFTSALFAGGCSDRRVSTLRSRISQIIDSIDDAISQQESSFAPKLASSRIRELGFVLDEACLRLDELGIPNTLLHGDICLENILAGPRGSVFTDWANAAVGNPFITFEQLRAQIAQESGSGIWLQSVTDTYREQWLDVLTHRQIDCALIDVQPIAIMSYLLDHWDWIVSERRHELQFQRYLRGMARQIDRAARALEPGDARCA